LLRERHLSAEQRRALEILAGAGHRARSASPRSAASPQSRQIAGPS
jgi:hypothetical protein